MLARIQTAGLVVVLVLSAPLRADEKPKGDKALKGEWEQQRQDVGGLEGAVDKTFKTVAYFYEDEATIYNLPTVPGVIIILDDATLVGTFRLKLDATKKLRFIDATVAAGPDKGQVRLGIYEVKGDELRLCQAPPGKDRPTDFSPTVDNGWTLRTFKRVQK